MRYLIAFLMIVLAMPSSADPAELPDPLRFADGRAVTSAAEWPARRAEMVSLVLDHEYGRVPPSPGNVRLMSTLEEGEQFDGRAAFRAVTLGFGPEHQLGTTAHLYLPVGAKKPSPVILRFGLGGEHAEAAIKAGFAFVAFEQTMLDPDTEGYDEVGPAQVAYPEYDWGSVAVWAWCASRVLDYAVTLPEIDGERTVITGHSRTGKAALLAGALDERFALVVPNGSGAGGAALFRHAPKGVETLALITEPARFKSWFKADFGQYGDDVNRLPLDQHFMRALVAPRAVLSTDARGDRWANPEGVELAWRAALPVFELLGVPERNLMVLREGGHDQLAPDFAALLEAATRLFGGEG